MSRRISFAVLLLLSAAFVFGMGAKEEEAERISIRVGALKGPTGIGMIRLFEAPPELPRGNTLSMEAVPSADAMAAKLLAGELDAAALPVNMAAKLHTAGLKYRLAAIIGEGMISVITTDPSIKSFEDLAGREVHVAGQGATPEYLMRTIAKKKAMDPDKDLRMAFHLPYPEIAASIVAGRVSVAVLPEPFATLALRGNPEARVAFDLGKLWTETTGRKNYPMTVFVVRDSLLADHPETARALLEALEASISWVKANPSEAGALVEKHDLGLKAAIASAAIPRSAYVFIPAARARTDVEALLSVFLEMEPKSIGGKLPDASFYADVKR